MTPNHFKFQVDRSTYNAGLRAKLDTGPVRHAITFMGTLYSDRNLQASVNGTPLSSNIYDPVARPRQDIAAPASVPKVSSSDLTGFALADTPVSYTHLDVYKRQALGGSHGGDSRYWLFICQGGLKTILGLAFALEKWFILLASIGKTYG